MDMTANNDAQRLKGEVAEHFAQLAARPTRYGTFWRRASEAVRRLPDDSAGVALVMRTNVPAGSLDTYFLDILCQESLADLVIQFFAGSDDPDLSETAMSAFVELVLEDIAMGRSNRRRVDLVDEDVTALRERNSGNWIGIDPTLIPYHAPFRQLAVASPFFTDLVEAATAAGYQTDAYKPVLLSFHLFAMREALRAEVFGQLGDVEAWLSGEYYELVARYVADLATEWEEMLMTIRSRNPRRNGGASTSHILGRPVSEVRANKEGNPNLNPVREANSSDG
jgi:hypothetical protein